MSAISHIDAAENEDLLSIDRLLPRLSFDARIRMGNYTEGRNMTGRQRYSTGSPWEPVVGYSRCVRVGNFIYVSGTTATGQGGDIVGEGDPYAQTKQAIANIEAALRMAGAGLADVVRTRIYVTDIARWEAVGRAHGEAFGEVRPASAMVEVARLIDPRMMVEIEADAIVAAP